MKRALVELATNRIAQVEIADFPVAVGLEWFDCPDDCTPQTYTFDGTSFIPIPVPVPPTADQLAAAKIDAMDRLQFFVLFNHENRIRALELKAQITQAQFRDALIAQWKALNP